MKNENITEGKLDEFMQYPLGSLPRITAEIIEFMNNKLYDYFIFNKNDPDMLNSQSLLGSITCNIVVNFLNKIMIDELPTENKISITKEFCDSLNNHIMDCWLRNLTYKTEKTEVN